LWTIVYVMAYVFFSLLLLYYFCVFFSTMIGELKIIISWWTAEDVWGLWQAWPWWMSMLVSDLRK